MSVQGGLPLGVCACVIPLPPASRPRLLFWAETAVHVAFA